MGDFAVFFFFFQENVVLTWMVHKVFSNKIYLEN